MRSDLISVDVEIPEGVNVEVNGNEVITKGPKGEVKRSFDNPKVNISTKDGNITISSKKPSKKEKAIAFTYRAHLRNMVKGVVEPFKYQLKICSSHFPMNVSFNNNELVVKNFFGEKFPRKLKIDNGVAVKLNDKIIELESPDKEMIGMTASNIESLTRVTEKDLRIFQDGIYIINKAGKEIK